MTSYDVAHNILRALPVLRKSAAKASWSHSVRNRLIVAPATFITFRLMYSLLVHTYVAYGPKKVPAGMWAVARAPSSPLSATR